MTSYRKKKKTLLSEVLILFCGVQKIPFPIDYFRFLFHKKLKSPALTVPPLFHLTPCTPTKSNFYLANSLAAVVSEHALYRLLTFQAPNLMSLFYCLVRTKVSVQFRDFEKYLINN